MDHQSNSTDYNVFIENMEYVNVTDHTVELVYDECNSCLDCPFNITTTNCEFSTEFREEDYYKLLHYISIHHPEKLI